MSNQFLYRHIDLSGYAGKTLAATYAINDVCSPAGEFDQFFNDIAISSPDGTVTTIYSPTSGAVFGMTDSSAHPGPVTNMQAVAEPNTFATPGSELQKGIHYYLSDQVGTTQMEISGAGWPVWQGYFTPFGEQIQNGAEQLVPGQTYPDGTSNRYKFTGKERDTESGLDYFGARYYASNMGRFMSPDWDSKPQAVPYANLADPQSLNLYSYVLNNPLSKTDPNGHDWFNVDGKWQWQKGHTYHDADGNATKAKGYAGLLVATATGTNKQGATTYSLTLYDQNKVVATGTGFSGNNNYADTGAIKVGNYQILGRFDAPPTGPNPASADNNPPPVYGFQKIDPTLNSYANAVYQAYGPMRARLNPLDPNNTDGVYFHGQFGDAFHSEGWTHGCLSYGRDTTMIDYMANHFGNAWTGVSVNTPVVKP